MSRARAGAARSRLWLAGALVAVGCSASAPPRAEPNRAIPGVTVNAPCVRGRCAEGLMCRVLERGGEGGELLDRCVLAPGRCRDHWDCGRASQRCRRFGTRLGVCQDVGF